MINKHLSALRFCKVRKGTKKPFEADWTNKPYKLKEIGDHIKSEVNYGVLCGEEGLAVIDCDKPELRKAVEKGLPETHTTQTGSGGIHFYYKIPSLKKKIVLQTDKDNHYGEVQSHGTQVVGAGSIHPSGKKYETIKDVPIVEISEEQLLSVVKPFMKEVVEAEVQVQEERKNYDSDVNSIPIKSVMSLTNFKRANNGELSGSNPWHGSEGGNNTWVNETKNIAHCFRCGVGISPIKALALTESIISNCGDELKGDNFIKALKVAEDRGLVAKKEFKPVEEEVRDYQINKINFLKYIDFENMKIDKTFIVERVIRPKTITMLYSPPGQFKSLVALDMAMSIANGKEWMKIPTMKNPVLYCDMENNEEIIKERLENFYKGHNYNRKNFDLYFLVRQGNIFDIPFMDALKKKIKEHGIKVVFFDTLHRFGDYNEDKADDINRIYLEVFLPLLAIGCSVVFLHHSKKDGGYRGSSDLLGLVDTAYNIERDGGKVKKDTFTLLNEKSRSGEIPKIRGEIDFGEDYTKVIRLNEEKEEVSKISKLKELTDKIKSFVPEDAYVKRKNIQDALDMAEVEYSIGTLKRSLEWLKTEGYFDYDPKQGYRRLK